MVMMMAKMKAKPAKPPTINRRLRRAAKRAFRVNLALTLLGRPQTESVGIGHASEGDVEPLRTGGPM